jgi:hypothetical protein
MWSTRVVRCYGLVKLRSLVSNVFISIPLSESVFSVVKPVYKDLTDLLLGKCVYGKNENSNDFY